MLQNFPYEEQKGRTNLLPRRLSRRNLTLTGLDYTNVSFLIRQLSSSERIQ